MTVLRIAVMSDLHAHSLAAHAPNPPSYLSLNGDSEPLSHPIEGLKKLIDDEKLNVDLLLCPGDMGDKADHAAQSYVWDQLQQLGKRLDANFVLATAGNHDMDSRHSSEIDAKGILQSLSPMFPGLDEIKCDRYWSRNFVIHDEVDWRILILNSSAYHGGRRPEKAPKDSVGTEELEYGRVSQRTISAITRELETAEKKPLNILLCHHHPVTNDELSSQTDYSSMVGGDLLISMLQRSTCGDWLIIHGHKHFPRLWYAGGSTGRTPVILSAGSLSARLYSEIAGKARNQFYIVEIDADEIRKHKVGVVGEIAAWDWIPSLGWQQAAADSSITLRTGFGWRENPERVAATIADHVQRTIGSGTPYLQWDSVRTNLPMVKYLNGPSFSDVEQILKTDHKLAILYNSGQAHQIGPAS